MMFLLIVTLSAMLLAAIMSVIAWRIAAEERRRSDARIAALAADIHAPAAAPLRAVAAQADGGRRAEIVRRAEPVRVMSFSAPRPAPRWGDDLPLRTAERVVPAGPDLFAVAQPARSSVRFAVMTAFVVLAFAAAVALATVSSRGAPKVAGVAQQPASGAQANPAAAPPAAPAAVPLELVALGHERDGDRLTVRGVVRNPASATTKERLTAVVVTFDADGGFLASGRAIIEAPALQPGGESAFVVIVPGASGAGRYRVSFRTDDRTVPHVDRREPPNAS